MHTETHNTQATLLEAHLASFDWIEVAVNTWLHPAGTHIASLRVQPVVSVSVEVRQ